MKLKILNTIGDIYAPEAKRVLSNIGEVDYLNVNQKKLKEIISDYDVIIVGLGLNIDREAITGAKKLKIIATATTGLDHIDVDFAETKGIQILSLRGETEFLDTITGTAELAFGLLLDLNRYISIAFESVKNYQWEREKFRGHNLYGKNLGIVGLGRLGRWMARYGKAFKMEVMAYDPKIENSFFINQEIQRASFEELLEKSDIISVHVHLAEDTENMFNRETFEKMKTSALLINTARGKIINEKDLLEALINQKIAGYASDVLADELEFEKNFSDHPLIEYAKNNTNCLIVPHIGGMTHESREATDIFIANKIIKHLKDKELL